jgi:hypothetical protein
VVPTLYSIGVYANLFHLDYPDVNVWYLISVFCFYVGEGYERPVIEVYPSNSVTVDVGASPLFLCRTVEGIPTPEISWTRLLL